MDFSTLSHSLGSNPLLAIALLYAGGVMTSLTPCIYPMIPITAAIVGGQLAGDRRPGSGKRAALLVGCYVLGLAAVYSALGVFAGLSGTLFGSVSTNPWLYFLMANVLVLAALAMMDVIPVRLPVSWTTRSGTAGKAGSAGGALVMGAVSGLVAAPCSAPVMAVVLTWVSATKSGVLGFFYLLSFSLGMCTLLIVVGLSAGTVARLPKAGVWMIWVKRIFAAIMLGVAEYYLIKMGQLLF